jgi:Zn-dependent protease with chaperone function
VHKGLMEFVIDRNQLAIVLGHEMAHALLKHGVSFLSCIHFSSE